MKRKINKQQKQTNMKLKAPFGLNTPANVVEPAIAIPESKGYPWDKKHIKKSKNLAPDSMTKTLKYISEEQKDKKILYFMLNRWVD
jgi:hypothetical protein